MSCLVAGFVNTGGTSDQICNAPFLQPVCDLANTMLPLLWKLTPQRQKDQLLAFMTQYQRQLFKKVISGRLKYCSAFDDKKCIFVHIPKTAGISLCKGLFSVDAVGHMPMRYYQVALGREKYSSYFKFSIVRNPWDRVYSAYRYLLKGGLSVQDVAWRDVLGKYSDFNDFIMKWLDEDNIRLSLHFMPQNHFIKNSQGLIDLDYLGRFENLVQDFDVLRRRIGGSPLAQHNVSGTGSYLEAYSKKSVEIVAQVYRRDIDLLGYEFNTPKSLDRTS